MSKRVVIYARVSGDEQAEKGYSLPTQIENCHEYAKAHDLTVTDVLQDDYSGFKIDRPELERLRGMVERGEVSAIIVHTADRWTRKVSHGQMLREELQRAGVELHFVSRGKFENTPEARLTGNIEDVFSEYWRDKIIEACRRGARGKAKAGKIVGRGKPPFGYDYKDGDYISNDEAETVKLIFDLYVYGDENGNRLSAYAIARKLSEAGILTAADKQGKYKVQGRGQWSPGVILQMIQNETYAGLWHYGKERWEDGKLVKNPDEQLIAVPCQAIVSREVWEAAQTRLAENKRLAKRNRKHDYLLSGRLKCGECGRPINGMTKKGAKNVLYRSYICNGGTQNGRYSCYSPSAGDCSNNKHYRLEAVEKAVWDWLCKRFENEEALLKAIDEEQVEREVKLQPRRKELETVNVLIVKNQRAIERVRGLYYDGHITQDECLRDSQPYKMALDDLEKDRIRLEKLISETELTDEIKRSILELARDVQAGILEAMDSFEERRRIIERLNVTGKLSMENDEQVLSLECVAGKDTMKVVNTTR